MNQRGNGRGGKALDNGWDGPDDGLMFYARAPGYLSAFLDYATVMFLLC